MSLNAQYTLRSINVRRLIRIKSVITSHLDRILFTVYGHTENSKSKTLNFICAELALLDEVVN